MTGNPRRRFRRWFGRVRRSAAYGWVDPLLEPSNSPIEEIAHDLQRLLWEHDMVARSNNVAKLGLRLCFLEAAISDRAMQAARALGVPHPDRPAYGGFDQMRLSRLLNTLSAQGLVLPPVALLPSDSRF